MPESLRKTGTHELRVAARAAWVSGSFGSVISTIALAVCGKIEEDSAAGPNNGPSQWVWGEEEAYTRKATLRHTAVGYAVHHMTSVGWATAHEHVFGSRSRTPKGLLRHCLEAAATATTAYVVDYHFTPSRFRPGFKKHLGPTSIAAVYAAFALGLAMGSALHHGSRRGRVNSLQESHAGN
jgi:hypothetical protein